MQKVTNLGHFVRNRLPSAQNVPLCAVQRGRGGAWLRWAGRLLVVRRGGVLPGILPSTTVVGQSGGCWWCGLSGSGVVLHIHSEVLAGVVAWFQRFPGTGGVRGRDECATWASLHIHPGSRPRVVRRIRVIPPFTDRGL